MNYFIWAQKFFIREGVAGRRPSGPRVRAGHNDSEHKSLMHKRPSGLRPVPIQSGVRAGFSLHPSLSTFYLLPSTFYLPLSTFYLLLSTLLLSSCTTPHDKLPAEIIPPDSMVQILADFYLAEALASEAAFNQDGAELRKSFYKYIINAHSTNHERLKTSIDYYSSRPGQFSDISEKVIEELSRRQAKANESTAPI